MIRATVWASITIVALLAVDRALLWAESRGCLYYRRNAEQRLPLWEWDKRWKEVVGEE